MLQQVAEKLGLEASALTADNRFRMIAMNDIRTLERDGCGYAAAYARSLHAR